jgi:hypothetical protein
MFLGLTNKQAIISGIVITLVVILSLFIFFRTRAAYTVPDTAAAGANVGTTQRDSYDTYVLALDACTTNYATDILAGLGDTVAGNNRNLCIDKATFTYVAARCPPLNGNHGGNPTAKTQWDTDKTNIAKMYTKVLNDLNGRADPGTNYSGATQIGQSGCVVSHSGLTALTITSADGTRYIGTGGCNTAGVGSSASNPLGFNTSLGSASNAYITYASVGITSQPTSVPVLPVGTVSMTMAQVDAYENAVAAKAINLSRNADIAAATRKYIATACTDFYVADGLTTGGLPAITSANASKYKELYFPDVTTAGTAVGRINAVTPLIKKWLPFWIQRAAIFSVADDGRTSESTILSTPTTTTMGTLGSVSSSSIVAMSASTVANFGTKYNAVGAIDPSGLTKAPSDDTTVGTMQTMKNWHLARMYGAYSCWYLMDADSGTSSRTGGGGLANTGITAYTNSTTNGTLQWA